MPRLILAALALSLSLGTAAASPVLPACKAPARPLQYEEFVRVRDIDVWVTIKGASCANPVLFVVHGGPGNPNTPYADNLYGAWTRDFTVVQWDQRGAGRTFAKNRPAEDEPLTMGQMAADGAALAEQLAQKLGKRKLVLMGGSWGSALAVHILKARPDLFHAYVGTAHVTTYADWGMAYAGVLARARVAGDKETAERLEALGAPPWTNPRHFGVMRRAMRRYENMVTEAPPKSWWVPHPSYATPQAQADYTAGEDYSFLQFIGLKGNGMASRLDLPALGTEFTVPFFMVQGAEDLLTPPVATRRYFEQIKAPVKEYFLLPRTGHDPNQIMVDAQYRVLKERVLPLVKE